MKKNEIVVTILVLLGTLLLPWSGASATTDGFYQLSEVTSAWDGTEADRTKALTADYDYTYGDEENITYTLPWSFNFYGQSYRQINVDTNGNVWFGSVGSAHSFNLGTTGRGPVIAAWNNDLSSYYYGGVFIQHKADPERVVIEWKAETYTEEGFFRPNDFEVVLFPNGAIRYDYKLFSALNVHDFGSGISRGNRVNSINLSTTYSNAYTLAGRSFQTTETALPAAVITPVASPVNVTTQTISGLLRGTSVTVIVDTTAQVGEVTYPTATSWSCTITGLTEGTNNITMTARDAVGNQTTSSVPIVIDTIPPTVQIMSPAGLTSKTPLLDYAVSDGTVTVKVDGTAVSKVSGERLDPLSDGPHTLRVEARDLANNLGSADATFTVDSVPPVVTITKIITPAGRVSSGFMHTVVI